ncbi:FAD-dependent monooxygenase [Streptomyces sp. NPDC048290]|uniref:FAD-dependent monooxygenase n=1 Tax=Streptomyces sp. NPDC048290 TaxID=3155811 RepID=UPI00342B2463
METQQVVIAGGGPVGLWLAAELRLNGVSVTVLEERTEVDQRSKALTMHPRSIELLASRGLAQRFQDGVPKIPTGHFGNLPSRLDFSLLDTPYPYTLFLPQARTEELFEEYAVGLGATIRRGHRVTGFTESADAVTVRVAGPQGEYEIQAEYLAGCDGTRSTVREAAGIDFPGTPSHQLGWLGDVALDNPPPLAFNRYCENGCLIIVPLPGGRWRIAGTSPDGSTTEWPGDLTLEELREKTVAITGDDFGMRDPSWLSRYGNATRLATEYRRGRVVLAGDAAHQHFPTGGVGMNVGMQDAHNLGWKLAATLQGWASHGLLDSYHTERHLVGAQLEEHSRAQTLLLTTFTPEAVALRSLLAQLVDDVPDVNRFLAGKISALGVRYPSTDPTAHPLTGARIPELAFTDTGTGTGLFALLRADSYLLLDLTGTGALADRARDRIAVHAGTPGSGAATGVPGGWDEVRAVLVRPDGHVAWAGTEEDDSKLTAQADAAVATALGARP